MKKQPHILFVAFEAGRWGPARLVEPLAEAGLRVSALTPADNVLAFSSYLDAHHKLASITSATRVAAALDRAVRSLDVELIIPCDERAVACLHAIARKRGCGRPSLQTRALLARSLGDQSQYDALLFKSRTLDLARSVGIAAPLSQTVDSARSAVAAAGEIGYPVYLKTSFGWAGTGVARCENDAQLRGSYDSQARPPASLPRRLLRRLLGRAWYPTHSEIDVQEAIDGASATYSAVAWRGELLTGFASDVLTTLPDNGPSVLVRLHRNRDMENTARKLIAATGATGFLGFDFIIEESSGEALLIECNPRPGQIGHLGSIVGADLCEALAAALRGADVLNTISQQDLAVTLFPQSLLNTPEMPTSFAEMDMPLTDDGLLKYSMKALNAAFARRDAIQPSLSRV